MPAIREAGGISCNIKIKYEVLSNEGGYLGPSMHAQSGRNEVAE